VSRGNGSLTYASGSRDCIDCPSCGQAAQVVCRGDQLTFDCDGKCGGDIAALLGEDELRRILAELVVNGHSPRTGGAAETASQKRERLASLLALPSVGLGVTGARVTGRGSMASADLYLSDDSTVTFESLSEFANISRLAVQMAACTGVVLTIDRRKALQALTLLREIAEHVGEHHAG
jgi:hypothetical protein